VGFFYGWSLRRWAAVGPDLDQLRMTRVNALRPD